tara:strand:- start:435 stop:1466 length:1032 start_codon:yes stop_codon:yes gene_type:complete
MNSWTHKHILTLANFSKEDFKIVIDLAHRFNSVNNANIKKLTSLKGFLITSLFFEASTRTKNSFELAAKRLSADFLSFHPTSSSLSKGETHLDTARTYSSMGSNILIIRNSSYYSPFEIAKNLDSLGFATSVLSAGDGFNSHPSQGLLDLYTLTKFFSPANLDPNILNNKTILIIGDILHSRVARSNLWSLTAFGANIVLCGPETLVPEDFFNFLSYPPPYDLADPIKNRGKISISRSLGQSIKNADAVITLRLQRERMRKNLITSIKSYSDDYCLTKQKLDLCNREIPILHPGPINRDVEISSQLVDNYSNCLINDQVANGVPVRMALLSLLSKVNLEFKVI